MAITNLAMEKLKNHFKKAREDKDYGNGRFARKMLEEAEMNLAERIMALGEKEIDTQLVTTIDESDKIAIEHIFTGIGPVVFGFSPVCFGENIRKKFRFGSTKLKKQALVFRKRYGRIF